MHAHAYLLTDPRTQALKKLILKGSRMGPRAGALILSRIVNMSKSDTAANNASAIGTQPPHLDQTLAPSFPHPT